MTSEPVTKFGEKQTSSLTNAFPQLIRWRPHSAPLAPDLQSGTCRLVVRAAGLAVAPAVCDVHARRVEGRRAPGHVIVFNLGAAVVQSAVEHEWEDAWLARVNTPLRCLASTCSSYLLQLYLFYYVIVNT